MIINNIHIKKETFEQLARALIKVDEHLDNGNIEHAHFIVKSIKNSVVNNLLADEMEAKNG